LFYRFVSGIRAVPRAPGLTTVTTAGQSTWAGKAVATTPTKITNSMPSYPGGQGPRPTGSLTVTTRPVVPSTAARPELATLRTTKPAATPVCIAYYLDSILIVANHKY
jgi:hypothetical protein